MDCIWEELSANPIVKMIESKQTQIDEIVQRFDAMDDSYFTKEDALDLKIKLDKLENELNAEILKNTKTKKEQEVEIEKLHTDIDTLKETIHSLKKKGWLKSFTNKVVKWTMNSDNRKLLGDGIQVIRGFLPDDVKSTL